MVKTTFSLNKIDTFHEDQEFKVTYQIKLEKLKGGGKKMKKKNRTAAMQSRSQQWTLQSLVLSVAGHTRQEVTV